MSEMAFESLEPLRRSQSATESGKESSLQPAPGFADIATRAPKPKLMLINGLGEVSSIPSPVAVGKQPSSSDEDSTLSQPDTPTQETSHQRQLSVPSIFDSPVRSRQRDYSPRISPMKPPPSPPKRSLSPPKMVISNEGKQRPNHRRGHHHQHSLSHQIFLPPPERPPLPLPSALPLPTYSEIFVQLRASAIYILPFVANALALVNLAHTSTGESSLLALTFLSLTHLLISFVNILSRAMNTFEVWRTTTLRLPFGLQRIEFLSEFGLAVLSTFNGLYILKETVEDIIISFGAGNVSIEGSGSHHHHHHYVETDPQRYLPKNRN